MELFHNLNAHSNKFFLIAGPCVIEDESTTRIIAKEIKQITLDLGIPFIFKASYRKANRTSSSSFKGIGDDRALSILKDIKVSMQIPVTTDIHESTETELLDFVDIIQIPAFLCRQTALLEAAAKTGKIINIKKGQFMSAHSMKFAAEKVRNVGNSNIILTERGNSFGYNDLIVDMRNIPELGQFGYPVVLDCTHANQKTNQERGITEGSPEHIRTLAKAGIVSGAKGIFVETHIDPSKALSDGANMLKLSELRPLLKTLLALKSTLSSLNEN
jgi:2-dehydro-3-deoxyphosphooctonate aldolase (KDO 8-P synthase)